MTISELAKQCGIGVQAVRYYERRSLLPDPRSGGVGYRDYSDEDVRRVRFIKEAQGLGFTLKEITDLLALRVSRSTTCANVREKAQDKIEDIEEKIRTLQGFKRALGRLVAQCAGSGPKTACPILDALETNTTNRPKKKAPRRKR